MFWNLAILLLLVLCLSSDCSKGAEEELKFYSLATQMVALIPNILIAHFPVCRRLVSLREFKEYLQSLPFTQKAYVSWFNGDCREYHYGTLECVGRE